MLIKYEWNDKEVNIPCDTGDIAPHTRKVIQDVEYELEVEPTIEDFVSYLTPRMFDTISERQAYRQGLKKMFGFIQEHSDRYNLKEMLNENLEEDEYFVEFMKDRYEEQALESFEESNGAY